MERQAREWCIIDLPPFFLWNIQSVYGLIFMETRGTGRARHVQMYAILLFPSISSGLS